jgi:hypothetical protein
MTRYAAPEFQPTDAVSTLLSQPRFAIYPFLPMLSIDINRAGVSVFVSYTLLV